MTETRPPRDIQVADVGTFSAGTLPDFFDARDLEYRAQVRPLPTTLNWSGGAEVTEQVGQSCTGHALATVINTVLSQLDGAPKDPAERQVSPYMLYALARRYDEFPGEQDAGSSLRGALKGWFHHGVLLNRDWPDLDPFPEPDLYDPDVQRKAFQRPIGCYYRVNPYRLDDMQSAVAELNAICVSALIHEGWLEVRGDEPPVIERPTRATPLAGHAFAIVGYNNTGFIVQNSWGPKWGAGGLAVLTYDDWLQSCYDAWVVRPGVPMKPLPAFLRPTGPERLATAGLDLPELAMHVVNLGNDGLLAADDQFESNPAQIERIFEHMPAVHTRWEAGQAGPRHVVLYAHGGMTNEARGLRIAQRNRNWWLNNRVYPLFFAWQSGPFETLRDQLAEVFGAMPIPTGGWRDWLFDQSDRLIERRAGTLFKSFWDEMKENARSASGELADLDLATGPVTVETRSALAEEPGASLVAARLLDYSRQPGVDLRVHLVGHSAGAIFHARLLHRLAALRVPVASVALLAPALQVDEFSADVLPHLRSGALRSLTIYALNDKQEQDDQCAGVYHKSILYLVSRSFEARQAGTPETPLIGMARFLTGDLRTRIETDGGRIVISPAQRTPPDLSCGATEHTGFDSDIPTMTSVASQILNAPGMPYLPDAPLLPPT